MPDLKIMKATQIMPLVGDMLEAGKRVRITVTGMSMYPFLRENRDRVELIPASFNHVRRGDILLIKRTDGDYVLHRVIKKKNTYLYLNGDAQQWFEKIGPEQIIAKVSYIWREEKKISCRSKSYVILSALWQMVFPIRSLLIKSYRIVRRYYKKLTVS